LPFRFTRFATRGVSGPDAREIDHIHLQQSWRRSVIFFFSAEDIYEQDHQVQDVRQISEGFGRLYALNRIVGNQFFLQNPTFVLAGLAGF